MAATIAVISTTAVRVFGGLIMAVTVVPITTEASMPTAVLYGMEGFVDMICTILTCRVQGYTTKARRCIVPLPVRIVPLE
jgi:hypothetical protein